MVGVVVDLGFAEIGDGEMSATCKEEILEGDSTVENIHFMDSANGDKLDVVKTVRTRAKGESKTYQFNKIEFGLRAAQMSTCLSNKIGQMSAREVRLKHNHKSTPQK
jgi:hypothetical protein